MKQIYNFIGVVLGTLQKTTSSFLEDYETLCSEQIFKYFTSGVLIFSFSLQDRLLLRQRIVAWAVTQLALKCVLDLFHLELQWCCKVLQTLKKILLENI